jgi:hypothetical protein
MTFEIANAVVYPPRAVVVSGTGGANTVSWDRPSFGIPDFYYIYRMENGGAPYLIATLPAPADPLAYPLTYTDSTGIPGVNYSYLVTTVLADGRESTPTKPPTEAAAKLDQRITFPQPPTPVAYGTTFTISPTATSGLLVNVAASGACTVENATPPNKTVTMVSSGTCTLTASQGGNADYAPTISITRQVEALHWILKGFHSPIVMSDHGLVWNTVKGGSTVPFKFNVNDGMVERTDVDAVNGPISLHTVSCAGGVYDEIASWELASNTGSTALRYDATAGQFIQNWKVPKTAGACYVAKLTAKDGSTLVAYFAIK